MKEWLPILASSHALLRYIDGFAGPGEYQGGELGSPIISLRTVKEHNQYAKLSEKGRTLDFLFVEKDPVYYRYLKQSIKERGPWPNNFNIRVKNDKFENMMSNLLHQAECSDLGLPPTLLFVDPFGPAGFPMDLFKRLALFNRVDVLINLNILEFVQWILPDPIKHKTADKLYGGPRWMPALKLAGRARTKYLVDEYEKALQEVGWRGTSFEMVNRQNQTVYHLVFGTRNHKGLEAIKRAMRNASQTGTFRYTDRIDSTQQVLSGLDRTDEYPAEIGDKLFQNYEGQEVAFDHLVESEINWHRWWLPSDLRHALNYLEYGVNPRIAAVRNHDGRTRRRNTYPEGCFVTFGRPPQGRLL